MKIEEIGENLFTGYFIAMLLCIAGITLFIIWVMRSWWLISTGVLFSMYCFGRFYRKWGEKK